MYMTVLKMTRSSILNATNLLDLNDSNSIHQWLCSQQDSSRSEAGILYRVIDKNDEIFMYIQSKAKFNISNIQNAGFEYVKSFDLGNIDFSKLTTFDVQCFPCVQKDCKSFFIKNTSDRYAWLQRQFEKHGIQLISCTEYKLSNVIMTKNRPIRFETASYRGTIKVVDETLALNLLINGLGRLKNYGCGLMLVR